MLNKEMVKMNEELIEILKRFKEMNMKIMSEISKKDFKCLIDSTNKIHEQINKSVVEYYNSDNLKMMMKYITSTREEMLKVAQLNVQILNEHLVSKIKNMNFKAFFEYYSDAFENINFV